jgi:hypothetical protein
LITAGVPTFRIFILHLNHNIIDIEFPGGKIITFGISTSFWSGCHEFVDAKATDKLTGLKTQPICALAIDKLGYNVETKAKCEIIIEVIEKNRLLKIITFK